MTGCYCWVKKIIFYQKKKKKSNFSAKFKFEPITTKHL